MASSVSTESVSMRSAHSKHESYRPAQQIHARKFSVGSFRFPVGYLDGLAEREVEYDPQLNYALSLCAGWSYSDGQTLANKLKYYGLEFASVDEMSVVNGPMLIVASGFFARSQNGRVGILSFRGTEPTSAINWLTDADVVMRPLGDGMVHRGFYANMEAIWEEINDSLAKALEPQSKVNGTPELKPMECLYITGHSLGAAMAVVAGAKIFLDGGPALRRCVRGIYTYGQPAVGDRAFGKQCQRWFADRLYRHVFASDVVARLPPSTTGGFEHFGDIRVAAKASDPWMPPDSLGTQATLVLAAVVSCGISFLVRRLPRLTRLKLDGFFKYSIEDHSPTGYIEASRSTLLRRS
jgi:hypothetical protein